MPNGKGTLRLSRMWALRILSATAFHRCLVVFIFIALLVIALLYFRSDSSDSTIHPVSILPIGYPRKYCSLLDDPLPGSEGDAGSRKELTLRGSLVITRHGDRSSLLSNEDPFIRYCTTGDEDRQRQFDDFVDSLNDRKRLPLWLNMNMAGNESLLHHLHQFSHYPSRDRCKSGHLTSVGALQMIRLGRLLRDRYKRLLTDADIVAISTPYARTWQSAVAFLFGLTNATRHVNKGSIPLTISRTTQFCDDEWCACTKLESYRRSIEDDKYRYYRDKAGQRVRQSVSTCTDTMDGAKLVTDPLALFDALMGDHLCRNGVYPCKTAARCLRYEHVDILSQFVLERSLHIAKTSAFAAMSLIESGPIFKKAISMADDIDASKRNQFVLLSGHDITLRPLLHQLGIYDGQIPAYASRLAIELYSPANDKTNPVSHLRFLYDGVDRTNEVRACKVDPLISTSDFCTIDSFRRYFEATYTVPSAPFRSVC